MGCTWPIFQFHPSSFTRLVGYRCSPWRWRRCLGRDALGGALLGTDGHASIVVGRGTEKEMDRLSNSFGKSGNSSKFIQIVGLTSTIQRYSNKNPVEVQRLNAKGWTVLLVPPQPWFEDFRGVYCKYTVTRTETIMAQKLGHPLVEPEPVWCFSCLAHPRISDGIE